MHLQAQIYYRAPQATRAMTAQQKSRPSRDIRYQHKVVHSYGELGKEINDYVNQQSTAVANATN